MSEPFKAGAARLFLSHFGRAPEGTVFAPGRVNLIGEHVDYNDGLVLPMPVREGTAIAWASRDDGEVHVHAADLDSSDSFAASDPGRPKRRGWKSYARGMTAHSPVAAAGMDMLVTGNLPRGSGLSSSASLCVAIGRAIAARAGSDADPTALSLAAQTTEHEYAGVACGIMDQMAVAAGKDGHAMLLDCRSLDYELVPIPRDWVVATVESGVTRGLVEGRYNERRAQCETAVEALGVASLRDASLAQLDAATIDPLAERRARHVIAEIERVQQAAKAIAAGDLPRFGEILREGHASLRDLFETSVPEVDSLVETLDELIGPQGGARMTGGGFGGSVVAVMPRARFAHVADRVAHPLRIVFGPQ